MRRNFEIIRAQEYWSPAQCGLVLGVGDRAYWVERFEAGEVRGFARPTGKTRRIYINADSARAFLRAGERLPSPQTEAPRVSTTQSSPQALRSLNQSSRRAFRAGLAEILAETGCGEFA